LEITEGSAMRLPEIVISFMRDLSQRGVGFTLEDFGSGATSTQYLKDFQFDFLKIDGRFIKDVEHNAGHQVLVHALLSIERYFGMYTVAEAVETSATSARLKKSGVECQQGYFFGSPTLRPDWPGAKITQKARRPVPWHISKNRSDGTYCMFAFITLGVA
jgi:EAL domain-containing protein (putative c-di-GMP-specific phosphodiesterase class I)